MSNLLKLVPKNLPANETSDADRVLAALNRGIELVTKQVKDGHPPLAVAIVTLDQFPGGGSGPSWIVQGLSQIETIGLLTMAINDISDLGLDPDGPDAA